MNSESKRKKPFVTTEQAFMLGGVAVGLILLYIFTPKMEREEGMLAAGIAGAIFGSIGKFVGKLIQRKQQF